MIVFVVACHRPEVCSLGADRFKKHFIRFSSRYDANNSGMIQNIRMLRSSQAGTVGVHPTTTTPKSSTTFPLPHHGFDWNCLKGPLLFEPRQPGACTGVHERSGRYRVSTNPAVVRVRGGGFNSRGAEKGDQVRCSAYTFRSAEDQRCSEDNTRSLVNCLYFSERHRVTQFIALRGPKI